MSVEPPQGVAGPTPGLAPTDGDPSGDALEPIFAAVGAQWRLALAGALLISVPIGIRTLTASRTYTAEVAFTSEASVSPRSNLSALAAQIGVDVASSDPGWSPAFYADLIPSRTILEPAAAAVYHWRADGSDHTGSIPDYLHLAVSDSAKRIAAGIDQLRSLVSVAQDRQTGIVRYSVKTRSPELSEQVVTKILDLINQFNAKTRQTQASAERAFVEARLSQAGQELRAAEDDVTVFREHNRGNLVESPELGLELDRLSRDVGRRQQVVTSLSQSYEQARIEEVRDTPAITVIEGPELPAVADPRQAVSKIAVGALIGGFFGLALGLLPSLRT